MRSVRRRTCTSWRIEDHPDGGLQITHLAAPRSTARWTTGAFPIDQVREGAFFWTDEGSGEQDAIHFFGFTWIDPAPAGQSFKQLLQSAVSTVEDYIVGS